MATASETRRCNLRRLAQVEATSSQPDVYQPSPPFIRPDQPGPRSSFFGAVKREPRAIGDWDQVVR